MVDPKVRKEVPYEHILESKLLSEKVKRGSGYEKANITQKDKMLVFLLVKWAGQLKMVYATKPTVLLILSFSFNLALVHIVSGAIGDEIQGPAQQLLSNHPAGGKNGSFFHELRKFVCKFSNHGGEFFAGLWNEYHIAFDMTGGLVVLAMGDFPGEIWDEKSRVANPPNGVVENFGGREGLVATFMCQHPQSGAEQTLHKSVEGPQDKPCRLPGNSFWRHIIVKDVESGSQAGDVTGDVAETPKTGSIEAMRWNCVPNLLDGEIWKLEFVAIGIQENSTGRLLLKTISLGHGRERS